MSDLTQRIAQMPIEERIRLEERLLAARKNGSSQRIPRRADDGPAPLSFAQERLWILQQIEPDSTAYNEMQVIRMTGPLSVDALTRTIDQVAARHDTLSMSFREIEGELRQVVEPLPPTALDLIDLSHLAGAVQMAAAWEIAGAFRQKVFDLTQPPLWRVLLFRLAPSDFIFVRVVHHIITDGWSSSIFWREVSLLYTSYVTDRPAPLPPPPLSYRDFSVWQREWLAGERLATLRKYWNERLADLPPLNLPLDRPRPLQMSHRGAAESFVVEDALRAQLATLARSTGATLYMLLLAAFQVLLHRYSGQTDLAVGSPIANRTRPETEGLHGFFVNTLVMRADCSGNPSFRTLLEQVRQQALEAFAHQELPFEKLVEELHPSRLFNRNPLFDVLFTLQNMPRAEFALADLHCQRLAHPDSVSKFDLSLFLYEREDGLEGRFDYATDLFDAATIRRMAGHFQTLLAGVVANPDCPIDRLPLLTATERRQILVEWNPLESDFPDQRSIPHIFGEQAKRRPNATAVVEGDRELSYGELDKLSSRLAYQLQVEGVHPGDRVALALGRSTEAVVAILAVLKAGAVYLPLDPHSPPARILGMMTEAETRLLLAAPEQKGLPVPPNCRLLCIADLLSAKGAPPTALTAATPSPDAPAYLMYTSGSTGTPKGVIVPHRAVVRLVQQPTYVSIGEEDVFLQHSPLCFDASTFELWGALLNGAKVVVLSDPLPGPAQIAASVQRHRVSILWLTAAIFHLLVDDYPAVLTGVRCLLAGGDVLDPVRVASLLRRMPPEHRLLNGYGPTENTTFSCCHPVAPTQPAHEPVPIGHPIRGSTAYILDNHQNLLPIGVPGELYVGGAGLALGYLNRPDLTAERFLPHPFSDEPAARLYRTGDRARYREDGVIEFLGRVDRQVKIRGFRVEPGEIEAALRAHPAVQDAVVGVSDDEATGKQLVAWWIGKGEPSAPDEELRDFLRRRLPDYMLPAAFVPVDGFPLNPNGKIDPAQLPQPEREKRAAPTTTPQTPLERQLLALWQKTLGRKNLGIDDNFFDAGGHSLLAVRLMDRVSRATGQELPVASLFYGPTIRQQAALIQQQGWSPPWRSLVPVQPEGSRPPLFLVPPAGGTAIRFQPLATRLGRDQPIFSFDPVGFDGKSAPLKTIEEMATHYLKEMRALQPTGPYLIGGMCFGAHVAFEMARQLESRSEQAPLIISMDAGHPANGPTWRRERRTLAYYSRRLRAYSQNGEILLRALRFLKSRLRFLGVHMRHWGLTHRDAKEQVWAAHMAAQFSYCASPCSVKVSLLQSEEFARLGVHTQWREVALGGVQIIPFPNTTHRSLLLEDENVRSIAEKLREVIDLWIDEHWQERRL